MWKRDENGQVPPPDLLSHRKSPLALHLWSREKVQILFPLFRIQHCLLFFYASILVLPYSELRAFSPSLLLQMAHVSFSFIFAPFNLLSNCPLRQVTIYTLALTLIFVTLMALWNTYFTWPAEWLSTFLHVLCHNHLSAVNLRRRADEKKTAPPWHRINAILKGLAIFFRLIFSSRRVNVLISASCAQLNPFWGNDDF